VDVDRLLRFGKDAPDRQLRAQPVGVFRAANGNGRSEMASSRSGGSKRGFAAMDPAKQREIASKGGKASHGGGRKSSSQR
jgi:hypothetical protein